MATILIAEDDPAILSSLTEYLTKEGFEVLSRSSEAEGIAALKSGQISLCLIDITLTSGNGFGVFEAAKQLGIPAIFLTASAEESDAIRALDAGAEDYVEKPFRTRELLSRIRNALRRNKDHKTLIPVGMLLVDTEKGTVTKDEREIDLSALEWRLFMIFLQNRGCLLTRNRLLSDIWDIGGDYVNDNTLTVYIKRLRDKLEDDPKEPIIIETVRGLGYRMP